MKKMKKLLTGLLALVMTITTVAIQSPIVAKADDPVTTDATIDSGKTGSLTIYKYEYNGNPDDLSAGTGTTADADNLPKDDDGNSLATPLKGVTFTIYQIENVDGLANYYSENPTSIPSVDEYLKTDGTFNEEKLLAGATPTSATTDENGLVKFSNLPLGLYVVMETAAPDSVTSPIFPFIISVPMTKVDGSDWLYDIVVYPKNATSYAGITLKKTDAQSGAGLDGVTFSLEKKNETTGTWVSITKESGPQGDDTGTDLTLTTANNGLITVDNLSNGTYRFTEVSLGSNSGYILDQYTHYEFVIDSTQGAGKTISYTDPFTNVTTEGDTIQIGVTNDKPDLEKEVKDRTDASADTQWRIDSDYNVGDTIPYRLTIEVPTKITMLKNFTVTDTPTNLEVVKANDIPVLTLSYGATKDTAFGTEVSPDAYTVAKSGNGFVITFEPSKMADYAGKYIGISYNATLLDTAVVTTQGNPNTAKLEYDSYIDSDGNGQGTDTIEDNATIYTFKIDIEKTASGGTQDGNALKDVEFDLYKEVTAGTTDAITGDDAKALGLADDKSWLKFSTLTTDEEGKASQPGLANGTYYLVETKTNAGYNLLKGPVAVTLSIQYTTSTEESTTWTVDTDGNSTLVKTEINWEDTVFNPTADSNSDDDDTNGMEGSQKVEIINKVGFTLPSTGGVGTYIFVFVGVSMMAAAVILFFTTKKKEAQKN